tara:strand:- start:124 stop:663 length:540 start_codon:yes stop_codon:yes gene_type:complete
MSQDNLNNHLVSNVPNNEKNRKFIKDVNKMAKNSKSIWRLKIRYRKPKEGHNYSYGGSLKRDNANAFSVYIEDSRPYQDQPENQQRNRLWDKIEKLENENSILFNDNCSLRQKLALYDNPYIDFTEDELNDTLFELKQDIVDRFLEDVEPIDECSDSENIRKKYNLLMEALDYVQTKYQ